MNMIVFCDLRRRPDPGIEIELPLATDDEYTNVLLDLSGVSSEPGQRNLLRKLDSVSCQQSKNLLAICFIDTVAVGLDQSGQFLGDYVDLLGRLVCAYPEVTFRFIESPSGDKSSAFAKACPESFIKLQDLPTVIKEFELGQRDIFDPRGLRGAIRAAKWKDGREGELVNVEKKLESLAKRPCAYILEDEWDYAELVGYCAFRSGRYQVRPILIHRENQGNMERFKLDGHLREDTGGVLVHAWDIRDWKKGRTRGSFSSLNEKKVQRMVITGAGSSTVKLRDPKKWSKNDDCWLAWEDGDVPTLRGLPKPLGWIHDIQIHGLLPEWSSKGGEVLTFLDGVDCSVKDARNHHSAMSEAQEMSQQLLGRSHNALKNDEPLLAAVFSLEAVRWLRGYSSTLYFDAVQSLYEAETELELGFGSSGRSSRALAPKCRAKELAELMKKLSAAHLMPKKQVPEIKERIWTALRKRYLAVGAFEPAEEALGFIHDAHRERIGLVHGPLLSYCFLYLLKTWFGYAVLLALASCLFILVLKAPLIGMDGVSAMHSYSALWIYATPVIVLLALVVIWVQAWPSAALNSPSWIRTVLLSIVVLSAGNLALLSDPSHKEVITEHRGRAYLEAMGWTCGSALAQVLPNKFIHTFPGPNPSLASLSFGWRGKTVGEGAEPDLVAVEQTQPQRTSLWLENVIAGWLTFATGLSTIYRRASRG